ncbi:nitronate monooxygenase [Corynebacterium sp. NPDC060344]|uniref:nitronate monooxygenase n=1 Tax=Corynebacterium sp. NPDC060344 TaxID=3347101 RepID=UPI0036530A41
MFSPRDLPLPLVGAPMAGGPSSPELVAEVARAGGLGMIAAGYLSADQLAGVIAETFSLYDGPPSRRPAHGFPVRSTPSGGRIGVNLFVPNPDVSDGWHEYRERLAADFPAVELPDEPRWTDDDWDAKIELLTGGGGGGTSSSTDVATVTFTFGLPKRGVVRALNDAGKSVGVTVTSQDEARAALAVGADYLIVQGPGAGGHQSTFAVAEMSPAVGFHAGVSGTAALVRSVRALTDDYAVLVAGEVTTVPIIATGGVGGRHDVRVLMEAGAEAVQVGTLLLTAGEAGTREPHRNALLAHDRETVMTRCFSGRFARALENDFTLEYSDGAPAAYPHVHFLTSPIRAAATAAGDPEGLNLWAGVGHKSCRAASAAEILADLAP